MFLHRFCLLAGLGLTLAPLMAADRPGVVKTADGREWAGEIAFTNQLVVVNGTNTVPFSSLVSLEFDRPVGTNALPAGKGEGLLGYYFSKTNYQGPVLVRLDERIDFDWGPSEPMQGIPADRFSVVWTGELEAPFDGEYRFSLVADESAELSVSNQVVVTVAAKERGTEVGSAPLSLRAGTRYPVMLKYVEMNGPASVKMLWSGPGIARSAIPRSHLHAKSALNQHGSETLAEEGLLATYYKNPDFSGETFTRVDPQIDFNWTDRDPVAGFSRSRHAVRWQGQVKADFSEVYTFHVLADEPIRLWVDGRPLILPSGPYYMTEVRESLPLLAGERYDIRLEAPSTSAGAMVKLLWSSASTSKSVIPLTNLYPSAAAIPTGASLEQSGRYPRGVLLRNGSFIALPVERATESTLRFGRWLKNTPVSTLHAARIFCLPMSRAVADRIPASRPGLLLAKGDFVDGEFKSLDQSKVTVASVLFGTRSYQLGREVLAVALGEVRRPVAAPFELRLQDQSVLLMDIVATDPIGVTVRDAAVGRCRIPWHEVVRLRRNAAAGR